MAPTYVISVATAGDKAIAGPLVAAALVLDARIANPRFLWPSVRERRPQSLADFDGIPTERKAQVAAWLRARAAGTGIVTCTVRQLNEADPRAVRRVALGRAVMRAVEHARYRLPNLTLSEDRTQVVVSGQDAVPVDYVRNVPQMVCPERSGRPWQLEAAYAIARHYRDGLMLDAHAERPAYDFVHNNGYASGPHRAALEEQGLTPHHRNSSLLVREVRELL